MNNIFSTFFVILLLFSVEKVAGNLTRIVGGEDAPSEFGKFHASIQNLTGYHVCGGAVVSKWVVVTAAHCVYKADPSYMKVLAGTNNLNNGGKRYDVSGIIVHDNYLVETRENDIAMLQTRRPFDLRDIHVLKLSKRKLVEGDEVFVTGFGALEPNGLSTCTMQMLYLEVFNQETCEFAMRYATSPVTAAMFCTFSTIGEGTCHGDSGSPLVNSKSELVGVASWGVPCAVGFPDVHTRISPYVDWIQKHIIETNCIRIRNILDQMKQTAKYAVKVPAGLTKFLATEV